MMSVECLWESSFSGSYSATASSKASLPKRQDAEKNNVLFADFKDLLAGCCGVTQDMPLHDFRDQASAWPSAMRSEENSLYIDVPAFTRPLCLEAPVFITKVQNFHVPLSPQP